MSKAIEAGKSFLAGVLARLPEAARPQAQAIFEAAGSEGALEALGSGALGQSEINRQFTELQKQRETLEAQQGELTSWYDQNKAALAEYITIKPEYDTLKTGTPGQNTPAAGPTVEQIRAELEARDRAFASAMAIGVNLTGMHLHMFSEPLDMQELMADPRLGQIDKASGRYYGLQDAYNTKHGQRVKELSEQREKDRIQKLVDEGVAAKLKGMPLNQQQPYPLRDTSPSPLDALQNTERKTDSYNVDTAIAEYERLQAARNGAPA